MQEKMRQFDDLIHTRETLVDHIGPWYWLKHDNGAWDGPKTDWETSHKLRFLAHVKDKRVCLQAGGCQGQYPRLLSDHFDHVYTWEPDPLSFQVLVRNCQTDKVRAFCAALGGRAGFIGLNRVANDNVGMNTVSGDGPVPIMTIDQFNFEGVGLICLDVEGYENEIVRGALATIERCRPVVTCENGTQEITDLLKPLGYQKVDQSVSDSIYVSAAG